MQLLLSGVFLLAAVAEPTEMVPHTDVFVSGREYPSFRIPALVVTEEGTLLAFAEGRDKHHDHAANDIVLKRSSDGGRTWGKLIVVAEDGQNSLNNPQAVVLPESGRILLMYQRYPEGIHESKVMPGLVGPAICRNFLTHSDDDGKTWSEPRDITSSTKRQEVVTSIAGGPGIGIVLTRGEHAGRIVMPFNQGPFGKWKVYAVYSDDGGDTWTMGDPAPDGEKGVGNEVQMVELADGRLMLNSRNQGGDRARKVATSSDGGQTWTPLADDPQLPEPQCQGTIVRYDWPEEDGTGHILFANPASQSDRKQGTIKVSRDDGETWTDGKLVVPGGFAYSCLARLADGDVGLLFERDGYQAVSFLRLPMEDLAD